MNHLLSLIEYSFSLSVIDRPFFTTSFFDGIYEAAKEALLFYFDLNTIDGPMQLLPFFRRDRTAARKPELSICYTVPLSRGTIVLYTRVRHNATCIPRVFTSVNGISRSYSRELSSSGSVCVFPRFVRYRAIS